MISTFKNRIHQLEPVCDVILKLNLKNFIFYCFAFFMTSWFLGWNILPGVGISMISVIILFYNAPILLKRDVFLFPHSLPIFLFLLMHIVSYWLFYNHDYVYDGTEFLIKQLFGIALSIAFYYVFINSRISMRLYSKMILIHLFLISILILPFIYKYLFVFHCPFLSTNWDAINAENKNTLGYFLVFCFVFIYAHFHHKRYAWSLISLFVIAFSTIYVMSRGALLCAGVAIILFCVISQKKKRYIKTLSVIVLGLICLQVFFRIGIKTYNLLKADLIHPQGKTFFESTDRAARIKDCIVGFSENPFLGHGIAAYYRDVGTLVHNDYAQLLYEFGVGGFLLFLWIITIHIRSILGVRGLVSKEYEWLYEAQVIMLILLVIIFNFHPTYTSYFVWYVFAGSQIIVNNILNENKRLNRGVSQ